MEREVTNLNVLNEFCEKFSQIMEQYCRYIIVSGFVAIASGRTRGTEDIDLIMERVSKEKFRLIFAALKKEGFACMQSDDADEVYAYLQENLSVRFTWKEKPLPEMEIKFAKDALDEYQLRTRIKLPLTNLDVWFSDINVNIAFKEELLKSPKDLEDARHLRIVFAELVDEEKIKKVKELIRRLRL
ncbi:MAG TPA: hypothetical protein VJC21_03260 [Candidatus Nanoarchaeia archaeon]|nr:hypothetical protein [Candidatus Nanoarchaeia archaeon]